MAVKDLMFNLLPELVEVVVEVGTYRGGWPRRFLEHVPGDYTIYCVDSWEGGMAKHQATFRENLAAELAAGRVVEIHKRSVPASMMWRTPIDVLNIDGDHLAVLEDLYAWVPHVRPGGIIVGHDFSGHRQSPAVQLAAFTYFGGAVRWRSGPIVGRSVGAAGRIHSFWFNKTGNLGDQDVNYRNDFDPWAWAELQETFGGGFRGEVSRLPPGDPRGLPGVESEGRSEPPEGQPSLSELMYVLGTDMKEEEKSDE